VHAPGSCPDRKNRSPSINPPETAGNLAQGVHIVDEADDKVVDVLEVGGEFFGDKAVLASREGPAHLPHRYDQTVEPEHGSGHVEPLSLFDVGELLLAEHAFAEVLVELLERLRRVGVGVNHDVEQPIQQEVDPVRSQVGGPVPTLEHCPIGKVGVLRTVTSQRSVMLEPLRACPQP
jgi:hypothetical protein